MCLICIDLYIVMKCLTLDIFVYVFNKYMHYHLSVKYAVQLKHESVLINLLVYMATKYVVV